MTDYKIYNVLFVFGVRIFAVGFFYVINNLTEVTSTPTRPVENVVLTTKGLQEKTHKC